MNFGVPDMSVSHINDWMHVNLKDVCSGFIKMFVYPDFYLQNKCRFVKSSFVFLLQLPRCKYKSLKRQETQANSKTSRKINEHYSKRFRLSDLFPDFPFCESFVFSDVFIFPFKINRFFDWNGLNFNDQNDIKIQKF